MLPRPARVRPQPLGAIAAEVGAYAESPVLVSGVTAASALVRPGDLFAALPGAHAHGARFVADAVAAGAVAVLTDPAGASMISPDLPVAVTSDPRAALGRTAAFVYGSPSADLDVLGVTGTSGKTTTTYLLRAGLSAAGIESALIGTVGTLIGPQLISSGFTTPEAPELQALLAVVRERGVRRVAMEVSSHALALGRVAAVDFAIGAFTNLSRDHLDFHADMDDYFAAKASLFGPQTGTAVVVIDDDWGQRMAQLVGAGITVSTTGAPAAWQAVDICERPDGSTRFRALGPDVDLQTGCAIPGRYNVANALLALAILTTDGVPVVEAAAGIAAAAVPGRMQRVQGEPFLALVDYSHKPAAVESALRALRPLTTGKLIIVLGCGGDRDRPKRAMMGAVAARESDLLIVTDDNPRTEDPALIRAAMLAGALAASPRGEVLEVGDRRAAIRTAVAAAGPGDTVLIAGKGHETGQEIAGQIFPFDDVVELSAALEAST